MGREQLADRATRPGQTLLASVGRRLVRYRLGEAGFVELDSLELPLTVQYACFHPDRGIAYVACSNGGVDSPGDRHCLAQVELDDTGLAMLAEPVALPHRPLHAAVTAERDRLALAYNRPAAITVHDLDALGRVREQCILAEGADLAGHFPHQVIPIPGSQDLLLTCRGDDASGSSDENPGSLRVLRQSGRTMACIQTVAPNGGFGFGPRNCAFHPQGQVLYAVLERQNRLVGFRYRNGSIDPEPCWNVDLLMNAGVAGRPQLGGAIAIHPTGRYAFVVNRAHPVASAPGMAAPCGENSIVAFELDALTGEPRQLQRMALNGLHARCLALSPDGATLVAALRQAGRRLNEDGTVIEYVAGYAIFRVTDSGHMQPMHQHPVDVGDAQLFWADFAPA